MTLCCFRGGGGNKVHDSDAAYKAAIDVKSGKKNRPRRSHDRRGMSICRPRWVLDGPAGGSNGYHLMRICPIGLKIEQLHYVMA